MSNLPDFLRVIWHKWSCRQNRASFGKFCHRLYRYGRPAVVAANQLEQNFNAEAQNRVWVTEPDGVEGIFQDGLELLSKGYHGPASGKPLGSKKA